MLRSLVWFSYHGKAYEIRESPAEGLVRFGVDVWSFTQIGFELYPLTNAQPVADYIEAIKKKAEQRRCSLVEV
jgi:hypothetical protein